MSQSSHKPAVTILPSRPAICSDASTELYVLARITPPEPAEDTQRPLLNLGLVLDRSGSMSGRKLDAAKEAASFAIRQLRQQDRVSVTVYDDHVETIVPSTLAADKTPILRSIQRITAGNSTALHAGWLEGGVQVSHHLQKDRLCRVLLLSDGLANCGETNPDRIASDVHGLAQRGVSTTTMGVGNDYNEDLMEAMARSGDGNYYFIESAAQLPDIFASEMKGLSATLGHTVSLGLEPQRGVEIIDVLNDLDRNSNGRLQLPNLVAGSPVDVALKLQIPPQSRDVDLCFIRLAWTPTGGGSRQVIRESLALPVLPLNAWERMSEDPVVMERVGILEVARMRQKAIEEMEKGNMAGARERLRESVSYVQCRMAPSPAAAAECADLSSLDERLDVDTPAFLRKRAKFTNYQRRNTK